MKLIPCLALLALAACSKSEKEAPAAKPVPGNAGVIRGQITLAADVAGKIRPGDTVFLAARPGPGGGPPLAAKRLALSSFPMAFELTQDDAMIGGPDAPKLEGDVYLTVRIDQDGDAMTRSPGDLFSTATKVTVGDTRATVRIDQAVP